MLSKRHVSPCYLQTSGPSPFQDICNYRKVIRTVSATCTPQVPHTKEMPNPRQSDQEPSPNPDRLEQSFCQTYTGFFQKCLSFHKANSFTRQLLQVPSTAMTSEEGVEKVTISIKNTFDPQTVLFQRTNTQM